MASLYNGVTTRFLRPEERLVFSEERDMPFVIEAGHTKDMNFLKSFLTTHSAQLLDDIAHYGAILLRGFQVSSEQEFEEAVLSLKGLQGISEAFMSEEGRIHVSGSKYILHTNAVYKTGGTLYLGGFHSENYYSTDVPSYICFCCFKPSILGGETGLINMEKVYEHLQPALKQRLEKNSFFVTKWLVADVAKRYKTSMARIETLCERFELPVIGHGKDKFIMMYKPSIFFHPITQKPALQINFFELPQLNVLLRQHFMKDYTGKTWFWHRFVWRLPFFMLRLLERIYILCASFFYSPKDSLNILRSKIISYFAWRRQKHSSPMPENKVADCFNEDDLKALADSMRRSYCSCIWQQGDILLVDNRKIVHAGMPGAGPRLVRALICNPLNMQYSSKQAGVFNCEERVEGLGEKLRE